MPPKPHSVQETPFRCTKRHQSRTRYRRHPSGVPTATKAALGTGDTPLVYQTSTNATLGTGDTLPVYQTPPKPHSVQETPFRCTKRHQSRTRYRRHPSGVPNATKAALGTGDTLPVYQTPLQLLKKFCEKPSVVISLQNSKTLY